ncbi:MAG TPA: hypothetical protein PK926_15155 [Spirochaetota bacterium]|nr:hypothetical protein [Spirochaetota bacterium]
MKRTRVTVILLQLVLLFVPLNYLNAKKSNYWDYFREPERKKTTWYDLEFSLTAMGPLAGEITRKTSAGFGFTLGFHYQKNFFRAGLVLGYSLFPGMENGNENENIQTNFFMSVPLYADIAFDIRLAKVCSLVPFLSLGFSIDALSIERVTDSYTDEKESEDIMSLHQAQRIGLGLWFHLTKSYSLQINAAYVPLIEYGDSVMVVHLVQLSLGFVRRF